MTTFLPYPSFERSADCLDKVRRWKQVVECFQLLDVIEGRPTKSGQPYKVQGAMALCVRMWQDNVWALKLYTNWCLHFVLKHKTHRVTAYAPFDMVAGPYYPQSPPNPWWFGDERLHSSHRSNLLRKDPTFYGQYGWEEPNDLPYWWPDRRKPKNPLFGD